MKDLIEELNKGLIPGPLENESDELSMYTILASLLDFTAWRAISFEHGVKPEVRVALHFKREDRDSEEVEATITDNGKSGPSTLDLINGCFVENDKVYCDNTSLRAKLVWQALSHCIGTIQITKATKGELIAYYSEFSINRREKSLSLLHPTKTISKPYEACGTTLKIRIPHKVRFFIEDIQLLQSYMHQYHWMIGRSLRITLVEPNGDIYIAEPHVVASNGLFDLVSLSPILIAKAAADCLQATIRVPDVATVECECVDGIQIQVSMILERYKNGISDNSVGKIVDDKLGKKSRSVPLFLHTLIECQPLLVRKKSSFQSILAAASSAVCWNDQLGVSLIDSQLYNIEVDSATDMKTSSECKPGLFLAAPVESSLLQGIKTVHLVCNIEAGISDQEVSMHYDALHHEATEPRLFFIKKVRQGIEICGQQLAKQTVSKNYPSYKQRNGTFKEYHDTIFNANLQILAGIARDMAYCISTTKNPSLKQEVIDILQLDTFCMESKHLAVELQKRLEALVLETGTTKH